MRGTPFLSGRGDNRGALAKLDQALVIVREIGDRQQEGLCLGNLGSVYNSLRQFHKATEHFDQALVIFREIGDR